MDALNPAKRRAAQRPTPQRVYVKVTSEFDATGYMGVFRNCVYFWLMPCAEIAIARMMLALASPAWSVELNNRHSIVP